MFADPPEAVLHPDEQPLVAQAVEVRRREFTTGRHCARLALGRLGLAPGPIGKDDGGAPRWPAGVVGSITHCAGYRAAAVAWSRELGAVGIDAEPADPLPSGVLPLVARPAERDWLAGAPPGVAWDRVLFSAKESVYKTWFPLTGRWLDFLDAEVALDPARGSFVARILVPGLGDLAGRFALRDGLVVTAIAWGLVG
nr:4'-phosphopantetheinyl transferase superfamily protein [Asanoa iriomotensis]